MYVIVYESQIWGPFDSADAAAEWATTREHYKADWGAALWQSGQWYVKRLVAPAGECPAET